jgi:hypothetical protein
VGSGNVRHCDRLEVEATVVYYTELGRRELIGGQGNIHEELIMFPLGRRNKRVIHLDLAIDLRQKLSGALEEYGFEVWDGQRRKHHEGHTDARIHLRPR